MFGPHAIAAIANREGQDSQELLGAIVTSWQEAGVRTAGVIAENDAVEGACSAAFLRDIASGRRFSIRLEAAPAGTACHLDTAGIDEACAALLLQIAHADVVLLSKFGKTEAARRGLWAAFSAAIAMATPLLTTVSPKHVEAWSAFAAGAVRLDPDVRSVQRWWQAVTAKAAIRQP